MLVDRELMVLEHFLGFFSGNKLSDLDPDDIQDGQQIFIRFLDLSAKKFQDTDNIAADPDRERESPMETFFLRNGSAWKILVQNNIVYPDRLIILPNPPGEALSKGKRGSPAHFGKFREAFLRTCP